MSKFAKQYKGYRGVCCIDSEEKRRKALALFSLDDVWGIGRSTLDKLTYYGISTPLDFADRKESWVRSHFHKPGYMTWLELNGMPCIDTHEILRNKNICTSRSFGEMVGDIATLRSAIASFAASCANKLRGQHSVAHSVSVFLLSNRFRDDLPQYSNSDMQSVVVPTSDTLEISAVALQILERIYLPGIMYKKAGVIVSDVVPASPVQQDFFDPIENRRERRDLMRAMDSINHRYGVKTLHTAVETSEHQAWKMKSSHRSHNYLTDINDILTVRC